MIKRNRRRCRLQYPEPKKTLTGQRLRDYRILFVDFARLALAYGNIWRARRDYRKALEDFWAGDGVELQPLPKGLLYTAQEPPEPILKTLARRDLKERLAYQYKLLTKELGHFELATLAMGLPKKRSVASRQTLRQRQAALTRRRTQGAAARPPSRTRRTRRSTSERRS